MRTVGLIHRNLGDEVGLAFSLGDVAINFSGVLHGEKIFARDALEFGTADFKRMANVRNSDFADEFRMAAGESFNAGCFSGFTNAVGNVDGVEVGGGIKRSTVSRRMWSAST